MPSCFVKGCHNSDKKKKPGVTFHAFPKYLTHDWLFAIKRNVRTLVNQQRVCSEHFKPDDFEHIGILRKIKADVIPSLNLPEKREVEYYKKGSRTGTVAQSQYEAKPDPSSITFTLKRELSSSSKRIRSETDEEPKFQQCRYIKMDQSGNIYQTQKPTLNNRGKPTYLTTYQQFLCSQQPNNQAQNTAQTKDQTTQENTVLLENRPVQRPQTTPASIKGESIKNKDMPKRNSTQKIADASEVVPVRKTLGPRFKRNKKLKVVHNTSRDTVENDTLSISSEEPLMMSDDDPLMDLESECHLDLEPIVMLEEEPVTAYECTVCSFETIYEDAFKEHMLTHKRKETFHKCPKCKFKIKCKAPVKKHMVVNGEQPSETIYCGLYVYSDECKGDLDSHLEMHRNIGGKHLKYDHSYTAV